jgi:hypothetical protein
MERVELTDDDDDGLVACALPNFPNVVFGDDELPMTPEKRGGTVRKRGLQSFEVSYDWQRGRKRRLCLCRHRCLMPHHHRHHRLGAPMMSLRKI